MPPVALSQAPTDSAAAQARTFLEANFPFVRLSRLARADRHAKDAVYAAHKWWARRPPAVIRALLLAGALPAETTENAFWAAFADDDEAHLAGRHIGDPFAGGATTLVEAARLGATVTGLDVDPLAVRIARQELSTFDTGAVEREADLLLAHLRQQVGELFRPSGYADGVEPLHFFWLRRAACDTCAAASLMYRSLVLARDEGKAGAVVRDAGATVFCPDCLAVHQLPRGATRFACCGRRRRVAEASFRRARHRCSGCGTRRSHEQLRSGRLERVLVAVETTHAGGRRELRAPRPEDHAAVAASATRRPPGVASLSLSALDDGRVAGYGFETVGDLFSDRQAALFAEAFRCLHARDLDAPIREALVLGVSNALTANNLLCGYATDYGRVAPVLHGVRAYALPILAVELNPLHPSAGRGTLAMTLRRIVRSATEEVRRHRYDPADDDIKPHLFRARRNVVSDVRCRSAERPFPKELGPLDAVVTDPPYFDFIAYSELSLLHRAWLGRDGQAEGLGGAPIFPVGESAADGFARRLGTALRQVRRALKPDAALTFTFHSAHVAAWTALERAVHRADLAVTAVFPVWTDARAVGHGHAGNCEWDMVFVCRPATNAQHVRLPSSADVWTDALDGVEVGANDRTSMQLALQMAHRLAAGGSHTRARNGA